MSAHTSSLSQAQVEWLSVLPYNTVGDWAVRLQGGTVPGCVIQKCTAPWEASDWRGKRARGHIAAVDQWGTAEAGSGTLTYHQSRTAAPGNPGEKAQIGTFSLLDSHFLSQLCVKLQSHYSTPEQKVPHIQPPKKGCYVTFMVWKNNEYRK